MYPNLLNCEHIYRHESKWYEDENTWFCDTCDKPCPLVHDAPARYCHAPQETNYIDALEVYNGELAFLLKAGDGTIYEAEAEAIDWDYNKSEKDNIINYYEERLKEIATWNRQDTERLNRCYKELLEARRTISASVGNVKRG